MVTKELENMFEFLIRHYFESNIPIEIVNIFNLLDEPNVNSNLVTARIGKIQLDFKITDYPGRNKIKIEQNELETTYVSPYSTIRAMVSVNYD